MVKAPLEGHDRPDRLARRTRTFTNWGFGRLGFRAYGSGFREVHGDLHFLEVYRFKVRKFMGPLGTHRQGGK